MRKHNGEKPFKCDQCPYAGSQKIILKIHKRSVHENLYFECEQCEYKASQKSNLKTHIRKIHEGGKRKLELKEICTVCGETVRKEYLEEHTQIRHLGEVNRETVCNDSKRSIGINVEHKNRIKHRCDVCEYQTGSKQTLRMHVEVKHLGMKYKCDECNYQANSSPSLYLFREALQKTGVNISPILLRLKDRENAVNDRK